MGWSDPVSQQMWVDEDSFLLKGFITAVSIGFNTRKGDTSI
jgi:hypothetical protein